jgi:hypothetical protein
MRTIRSLYNQQFSTVCEELHRRRLISGEEWTHLLNYENTVPDSLCIIYRAVIQPVVALMRLFPGIVHIVHRVARRIWIDMAIAKGRDL